MITSYRMNTLGPLCQLAMFGQKICTSSSKLEQNQKVVRSSPPNYIQKWLVIVVMAITARGTISRIFHLEQQLAHYLRGHFKGRGGNDHLVDLVNFSSSISPKCLISSEKMIPKPQLPRCIFEYSNFASIYWQCSCLECNR